MVKMKTGTGCGITICQFSYNIKHTFTTTFTQNLYSKLDKGFILNHQRLERTQMFRSWWRDTFIKWNTDHQLKGINYWYTQQHGGISNYCKKLILRSTSDSVQWESEAAGEQPQELPWWRGKWLPCPTRWGRADQKKADPPVARWQFQWARNLHRLPPKS